MRINHTINIRPIGVDGIIVYDQKRPKGAPPQQMNKISIIASFSRNRRTETSLPSRPLIPGVNERFSMKMNKGGVRYMTLWEDDMDDPEYEVLLETNLHTRSKFDTRLEPKEFEVVVGLMRGDSTMVLGVSVLSVHGPQEEIEMDLPLLPLGFEEAQPLDDGDESVGGVSSYTRDRANELGIAWDVERMRFDDDLARGYVLAKNASLKVRIEVLDTVTYQDRQFQLDQMQDETYAERTVDNMTNPSNHYENSYNDDYIDDYNDYDEEYDDYGDGNVNEHKTLGDVSDITSITKFRKRNIFNTPRQIRSAQPPQTQGRPPRPYRAKSAPFQQEQMNDMHDLGQYPKRKGRMTNPYNNNNQDAMYSIDNGAPGGVPSHDGDKMGSLANYTNFSFSEEVRAQERPATSGHFSINPTQEDEAPVHDTEIYNNYTFSKEDQMEQMYGNNDGVSHVNSAYPRSMAHTAAGRSASNQFQEGATLGSYFNNISPADGQQHYNRHHNVLNQQLHGQPHGGFVPNQSNMLYALQSNDAVNMNDSKSANGAYYTMNGMHGSHLNPAYYNETAVNPVFPGHGNNQHQVVDPTTKRKPFKDGQKPKEEKVDSDDDQSQSIVSRHDKRSKGKQQDASSDESDDDSDEVSSSRRRSRSKSKDTKETDSDHDSDDDIQSRRSTLSFDRKRNKSKSKKHRRPNHDDHSESSGSSRDSRMSNEHDSNSERSFDDEVSKVQRKEKKKKEKAGFTTFLDATFIDDIFGDSVYTRKEKVSKKEEYDSDDESGTPPQAVRLKDIASVGGQTEITNFSQDSYEKYEKPDGVPTAFGGKGMFRPNSRERHIKYIPDEDEYRSVGKVMSVRGLRKQRKSQPESRETRKAKKSTKPRMVHKPQKSSKPKKIVERRDDDSDSASDEESGSASEESAIDSRDDHSTYTDAYSVYSGRRR